MGYSVRLISVCGLVAGSCLIASADNNVKLLQNYLKGADVNLVFPASREIVPGGLVVSDGKRASYNSLPGGVTFTPTPPTDATFFASTGSRSFSLASLLSSIFRVLKAGLSVNHKNTTTINQINATSQSIRAEDVIANNAVANLIKTWIRPNDKNPKYQVYVVIRTMSSSSISFSNTTSTGVAAAFGADLPTCPDAAAGTDTAGATGTSGSAAGTGTTGAKATSGSAAAPVLSGKPSASLKFCKNDDSKVTMTAANPEVFGVSLRPVTFDPDGTLFAGPVSMIVKSGVPVTGLVEPELIQINGRATHTKPLSLPKSTN